MDVITNPTKIPTISREEYQSQLFELRTKAILKKDDETELKKINQQLDNLSALRDISNGQKQIITENNTGFDIKI